MSQIHPAWIERQRKRFARPDSKLWVRLDAARYRAPAHYTTAKSTGTFSESHNAERQATHLQLDLDNATDLHRLHLDLLSLRGEFLALKFQRLLRKALHPGGGLDVSAGLQHYLTQPRVPPGNPDGGQWIGEGSVRVAGPSLWRSGRPRGHHYMPRELFDNKENPFRPETRKFFEQTTTGPLLDSRSNRGYDREHRIYNQAVRISK